MRPVKAQNLARGAPRFWPEADTRGHCRNCGVFIAGQEEAFNLTVRPCSLLAALLSLGLPAGSSGSRLIAIVAQGFGAASAVLHVAPLA